MMVTGSPISYKPPYDLVVGLGRSGFSVAKFLHQAGKKVKAVDLDINRTNEANVLESLGIEVVLGPHPQDFFDNAQTLFVSPGIPLNIPHIKKAMAKGVNISGELDLFASYNKTPVIGITGTNGKTTTAFLVTEMLQESGKEVFTGGNIGVPLIEYLMEPQQSADVVVAELSSFQLDLARQFNADVGVVLNIAEDHLDRYEDMAEYIKSKWSLLERQTIEDVAIVNMDIDHNPSFQSASSVLGFGWQERYPGSKGIHAQVTEKGIVFKGLDLIEKNEETKFLVKDMPLLELPHNRENVAAASLAALCAGATFSGIQKAVAQFTLPAHRMVLVREINGVRFYNDSKATNIHAVISALNSFEFTSKNAGILLIMGGKEKGLDFSTMIPLVKKKVRQILAIGEAAPHIVEVFSQFCKVLVCKTMDQAVRKAATKSCTSDVVLLSPACASFDMYKNYQERGQDFTDIVLSL